MEPSAPPVGGEVLSVCILAGGMGTRLGSLTRDTCKPMVSIGDRPFLHLLMEHLAALGLRRFILAVQYRAEQIRQYFGDGGRFGWTVEYSEETEPLGTGGAILLAQRLWGERVLALNGDTFLAEDWRRMIAAHQAAGCPVTMAISREINCRRYGSVDVSGGRVVRFLEKSASTGPGLINAGAYVLDAAAFAAFRAEQAFSMEKDVFPTLAGRIAAYVCAARPIDIGTPESLEEFRRRQKDAVK